MSMWGVARGEHADWQGRWASVLDSLALI